MVDEILDFDPHLVIGEEPARRRLGASGDTDDPLILFERLRRRRRDLERALAAIRREPVSVLRARRRFVPLRDTRRADLRTLRSALRQPATLAAIRPGTASRPYGPGSDPILDVPAVERTLDSPANRCILAMLRALLLRCRELSKRLERLAQKPLDDTRTAVANRVGRWNQILGEMGRGFATAERRRPFSDVRRPEITAAGLNAVAAHPLYARFWRIGWKALPRGVYRMDPAESAILSGMTKSVHPYADALRWGYRRPERTLLLVPNATQAEWLTRTDYVDRHRVGVVALRPDIELPDWFRGLLTDPPRPGVSTG